MSQDATYRLWHKRSADDIFDIRPSFPDVCSVVGHLTMIEYTSDKWPPFKLHDYFHECETHATIYKPGEVAGCPAANTRDLVPNGKLTFLASFTGVRFKDAGTRREVVHSPRGAALFTLEDRKTLIVLGSGDKLLWVMRGSGMRVTRAGIVG